MQGFNAVRDSAASHESTDADKQPSPPENPPIRGVFKLWSWREYPRQGLYKKEPPVFGETADDEFRPFRVY